MMLPVAFICFHSKNITTFALKLPDFQSSSLPDLPSIVQLANLARLSLEHTPISDNGLGDLQSLVHLQYLNRVGTAVTLQGIIQLKDLKSLQSLYLNQTKIKGTAWSSIQNAFPKANFDSGGYVVKTLATDTVMKKEY